MKLFASILILGLASCTQPTSNQVPDNDQTLIETNREEAIAKGVLKATEPFYPQPDFQTERVYKVPDQFGCKWWISSGHKFDQEWIALTPKQEPDCIDQKYAPEKTVYYLDKDGNRW